MKYLVALFVDGSDVDLSEMAKLGLIEKKFAGYQLTEFGSKFI